MGWVRDNAVLGNGRGNVLVAGNSHVGTVGTLDIPTILPKPYGYVA